MKNSISFLLLFSIICFGSFKKASIDISPKIQSALKTGNANELSQLFDQNVELVIESENVDFNKINNTHAKLILESFFKKKPPKSFSFEYLGTTSSMKYCTGNYFSGKDQFWVYILIKTKKDKNYIGSLHFKKE